jgi:hypothetical protein
MAIEDLLKYKESSALIDIAKIHQVKVVNAGRAAKLAIPNKLSKYRMKWQTIAEVVDVCSFADKFDFENDGESLLFKADLLVDALADKGNEGFIPLLCT